MVPTQEDLLRDAVFVPCETKEQLANWIHLYLDVDLPDGKVDPESNSSPLDFVWECYSRARKGDDKDFQRVLLYSARDGGKSLICSILEVLCVFHLGRNVGHLAAQLSQSKVVTGYLDTYLRNPYLSAFVSKRNERTIEFVWYSNKNGRVITEQEYKKLPPDELRQYSLEERFIKVVTATLSGANGLHSQWVTLDELDLADPAAVSEAAYIPTVGKNGELPITFLTSTRKFSTGAVQKEIDKAHETGLNVRHWNIVDIAHACEPERHRPDEPKIHLWVEEENPKDVFTDEEAVAAPEDLKRKLTRLEAYAGCKTCPIFAACKGRLATKKPDPAKRFLKPIDHVAGLLKASSVEKAAAQLMCWKPSREGMIYSRLSRERHMLTAAQMYESASGDPAPPGFTKTDLIAYFMSRNVPCVAGLDWGYSHAFSVVTGFLDGNKLYVVDVISAREFEITDKVKICDERIKSMKPTIYPDESYPSDIKTFRRHGYKMVKFTKDVAAGIEAVRLRLEPGWDKEPDIYILADDPGCELLFSRMNQYHYKIDSAGNPTEIPDKVDDDEVDALRYLCQNLTTKGSGIVMKTAKPEDTRAPGPVFGPEVHTQTNWMSKKINEFAGDVDFSDKPVVKRGSFVFSIG